MLSIVAKEWLLKRLEEKEEGYKRLAYDDKTGIPIKAPVGRATVGIGLCLETRGLRRDEAEMIAKNVIDECDIQLTNDLSFYHDLDEIRKCVLIDMAYNMGITGEETFKATNNLVATGFYKNAAIQMRRSAWYTQVPNRAEPLCIMMESGQWAQ